MRATHLLIASSFAMASLVQNFGAEAQTRHVLLRVISPPEGSITDQASSGWPLTIRLISQGELGISTLTSSRYPQAGMTGILLYSDPDHCPSWAGQAPIDPLAFPDCILPRPWPVDETSLRFTPDNDGPGLADQAGDPERQRRLTDSGGGGQPKIFTFDENTRTLRLTPIGPATGNDERDGYGYGADDDLPGLVILSDTGPGVVFDESFNLPTPRQARNLAGFVNSVSYELNDASRHTSVTAHLSVPEGLFNPVELIDNCVGIYNTAGYCTGTSIQRVDGAALGQHVREVSTVRIFVVNGTAPDLVADADGDGVVTAHDAQLAGYTLLSREAILRFRQYPSSLSNSYPFDFDRNDHALVTGGVAGPPGSVTLTKIPR